MSVPIDRAPAAAAAGFLPAARQRPLHRRFAASRLRRSPAWLDLEREIALGAVGQDLDRGIGARQPRREPRQTRAHRRLRPRARHQRAQPRPREGGIAVGRIVGEADPRPCSASRQAAISKPRRNGRASTTPSRSLCRAIAARPAMPLPRNSRINSVSAWSSRVCAVRICVAPALRAACASRRYRAARAAAGTPVFGFVPLQRIVRCGRSSAARQTLDLARLARRLAAAGRDRR